MKAFTNIEQSKKLAEILPIESADMWFHPYPNDEYWYDIPNFGNADLKYNQLPCWSTSALLEIIRNSGRYELQMYEGGYYFEANGFMTESYFNPVDACVEMITKLYEQKLI